MNFRAIFGLVAYTLIVLGVAMLACWGVSLYAGDAAATTIGLLESCGITMGAGLLLALATRGGRLEPSRRDGFGIVTFGWVTAALFSALPFLLSGVIASPCGALFESMSGLTTTGASVLTDLERLPRGILLWRAVTHLFGGMGVLILCVAILPFVGVGGMQIYRAEVPGPAKDRLTPRITTTAKLLWGVYLLLILVEAVLLRLGGMSWFDAVCHAFATMATGGFSTRTASVAAFQSHYLEGVMILFMFLAGVSFSLHYRALTGRPLAYFRDAEFRYYIGLWAGACLLLALINWLHIDGLTVRHALRASFFTGTSIMTTTGFCTDDFDLWPNASRVLLVILMFLGGSAGSTAGGMKVLRVVVVCKEVVRELRRFMQPQAVMTVKLGRQSVDNAIVHHIVAFFLVYILCFALFTMVMAFFTPDLVTAGSSVAATLSNIGPGLQAVGPMQNYAAIPAAGQSVLTLCMLLGRLELFTVLIVFLPSFWKK